MADNIQKLIDIMSALRNPDGGCPWDMKQTYQTIIPYTLEEAYEVADAIEQADFAELKLELGDLLFQVIFYCQLAKEDGLFEFADVVDAICEKLTRRHPHVFGDTQFTSDDEINANWEAEKAKERAIKQNTDGFFDNVPNALPALNRAYKIQKRCAKVGFDWPDHQGALDKVREEVDELAYELAEEVVDQDKVEAELGDLMFAMVNLARKLKLDPEMTLRKANQKFTKRFEQVNALANGQGKCIEQMELVEMEALWVQVKQQELID